MRIRLLVVGILTAALGCSAFASTAAASRQGSVHHRPAHHVRPQVAFSFAKSAVNQNENLVVRFAVAKAPKRAGIYLQRAEGTKHVWKSVDRLGTANAHGQRTVPGVAIGEWTYRVAVKLGKRTLAGSKWRHLYSYGPVSWAQWCNANGCGGHSDTVQIGTTIFTYNAIDGTCAPGTSGNSCKANPIFGPATQAPNENTVLKVNHGTCSSVTVSAAAASQDGAAGETGTISVVRSDTDPQTLTLDPGQIETGTFKLDNKPYYLEDWASAGGNLVIYMRISFHCYTTTGDVPNS